MRFAVIGYIAGFCTTISFVPQVLRAWRTRHTDDLAWGWLIAFGFGVTFWLIYGLVLTDWPMILANSVTLSLCLALMLMKLRFDSPAAKLFRAQTAD